MFDPAEFDPEDNSGAQDDEAVTEAVAVLRSDGDDEARARAALSLGPAMELMDLEEFEYGLTEPVAAEAKEVLWEVHLRDAEPDVVRRAALEALVRQPEEKLRPRVRQALDTPGEWRMTGLFCAGLITGFEDDVRAGTKSEVKDERIEAWAAAAELELHDLGGAAVALARDEGADAEERLAAIYALASLNDDREQAATLLLDLQEHKDEEIRAAADAAWDNRELRQSIEMMAESMELGDFSDLDEE